MTHNGHASYPEASDTVRYDASLRIHDMVEEDRPRERLQRHGAEALSNAELIAILLNTGLKGENVVRLSERLLSEFGGLGGLFRASLATLIQKRGLGKAKAAHLRAALVLGQRLLALQPEERPAVGSPQDVFNLLGLEMGLLQQEHLRVVLLDTRNRIVHAPTIYRGSVNTMNVRIAEVFKPAIEQNAPAIILVHNHPSGDRTPSEPDIAMTRQAYDAGKMLGIDLLDHIILVQGGFYSMNEHLAGFPRPGALK